MGTLSNELKTVLNDLKNAKDSINKKYAIMNQTELSEIPVSELASAIDDINCINTNDATADENDMLIDETAYARNEKVTGIMKDQTDKTLDANIVQQTSRTVVVNMDDTSDNGYCDQSTYLAVNKSDLAKLLGVTPDKIKKGEIILDVVGTYDPEWMIPTDPEDINKYSEKVDKVINRDIDNDGVPDLDIDMNNDGIPDINITDEDGNPYLNIDTDGDGNPDVNIDTTGDGVPDLNIVKDTDSITKDNFRDLTPDFNIDNDGDDKPDINILDEDGNPYLNLDTDGDGKPNTNIDTTGDGKPDLNVIKEDKTITKDNYKDLEPDLNIDKPKYKTKDTTGSDNTGNTGNGGTGDNTGDSNTGGDGGTDADNAIPGYTPIDDNANLKVLSAFVSFGSSVVDSSRYAALNVYYNKGREDEVWLASHKIIWCVNNQIFDWNGQKIEIELRMLKDRNILVQAIVQGHTVAESDDCHATISSNGGTIRGGRTSEFDNANYTTKFKKYTYNGAKIYHGVCCQDASNIQGIWDGHATIKKDNFLTELSSGKRFSFDKTSNNVDVNPSESAGWSVSSTGITYSGKSSTFNGIVSSYGETLADKFETCTEFSSSASFTASGSGAVGVCLAVECNDSDMDEMTGDGTPHVNIDDDGDGVADRNIDTSGDGIPDTNVDTDCDGTADTNLVNWPTGNKYIPYINVTDKDGKVYLNIDTDGDGWPDVNIDTDNDGVADINIDTDGDGKADANLGTVDRDGSVTKDKNVSIDGGDSGKDKDDSGTGDGSEDSDNSDKIGLGYFNYDSNGDGVPNYEVDGYLLRDDIKDDGTNTYVNNGIGYGLDIDDDGTVDLNWDSDEDGVVDTNITDQHGYPRKNILNPDGTVTESSYDTDTTWLKDPTKTYAKDKTTYNIDKLLSFETTSNDSDYEYWLLKWGWREIEITTTLDVDKRKRFLMAYRRFYNSVMLTDEMFKSSDIVPSYYDYNTGTKKQSPYSKILYFNDRNAALNLADDTPAVNSQYYNSYIPYIGVYTGDLNLDFWELHYISYCVFTDCPEIMMRWGSSIYGLNEDGHAEFYCIPAFKPDDWNNYMVTMQNTFSTITGIIRDTYGIKYNNNSTPWSYTPPQKKRIAKVIHDYIVTNSTYHISSVDGLDQTAYPALSNYAESPVCASYAQAFHYCCEKYGICTCNIFGKTSENHEWNVITYKPLHFRSNPDILKAGKYWSEVDATWDDPVWDDGVERRDFCQWKYFNRTTNFMEQETHYRVNLNSDYVYITNTEVDGVTSQTYTNSYYISYPVEVCKNNSDLYLNGNLDTRYGGQVYKGL